VRFEGLRLQAQPSPNRPFAVRNADSAPQAHTKSKQAATATKTPEDHNQCHSNVIAPPAAKPTTACPRSTPLRR